METSKMMRHGMILAAVAAHAVSVAPVSRSIDFAEVPGALTVTGEGAEVTLQPMNVDANLINVTAAIRVPGYQTIIVEEGAGSSPFHHRWVGIGKLSQDDPAPSVLLAGFTGGAHCCSTLKAIVPDGGRLRVVEFEATDGAPDERFPQDLDSDGIVDIVRHDDSFRYQFASGAGSVTPPVIYNIYRGQIVDVSTQPSFRPLWERFASVTRTTCADRTNDDRNGACSAYVAAAARLGRYAEAIREAETMAYHGPGIELPQGCRVPLDDGMCPSGQETIFNSFVPALRWFLQAHDYID